MAVVYSVFDSNSEHSSNIYKSISLRLSDWDGFELLVMGTSPICNI